MSKYSLAVMFAMLSTMMSGAVHVDRAHGAPHPSPPEQHLGDDCRVSAQHCARRGKQPDAVHDSEPASNESRDGSEATPSRNRPSDKSVEKYGSPMLACISRSTGIVT